LAFSTPVSITGITNATDHSVSCAPVSGTTSLVQCTVNDSCYTSTPPVPYCLFIFESVTRTVNITVPSTTMEILTATATVHWDPSKSASTMWSTCITSYCAAMTYGCGTICNGTFDCGPCAGTAQCLSYSHKCVEPLIPPPCLPQNTCQSEGITCGPFVDDCGTNQNCGSCTPPWMCDGAPAHCVCTPTPSCAARGWDCGQIPDTGCGQSENCGTCTVAGESCGGGGIQGKCGSGVCVSKDCAALGKNCGTVVDNCGITISTCGTCTHPETCGGGGVPNVCGCTPKTCAQLFINCGRADDGCGGTVSCGNCTAPETCGGGGMQNVCGVVAAETPSEGGGIAPENMPPPGVTPRPVTESPTGETRQEATQPTKDEGGGCTLIP
jgi:hypothetical protein